MVRSYDFYKTKYGDELLIDLINLQNLRNYLELAPVHTLTYYDITLITSGSGYFTIDGFRNRVQEREVFFSSPGQIRHWEFEKIPHGMVLIFDATFLCDFFNDNAFVQNLAFFDAGTTPASVRLSEDEYSIVVSLMETVRNEIANCKVKDKHILRALLYQIVMRLNRAYLNRFPLVGHKEKNMYVRDFMCLVERDFSKNRSVAYYADLLHITAGHLSSLVKMETGKSAKQFILDRTMTEARRLLGYSDMPVSEVACVLAFETASYFSRAFLQNTGQLPWQYRQKILKK